MSLKIWKRKYLMVLFTPYFYKFMYSNLCFQLPTSSHTFLLSSSSNIRDMSFEFLSKTEYSPFQTVFTSLGSEI